MTHPENQPPDDDGGTFKLKPGGKPASEPPAEGNLDSTMKLRKAGGQVPPPPPSPLGNPTGPADPPSPFADTTVMPQTGGSQTGFQSSAPQPPNQPGGPLGQTPPPQQGGQGYGQQPYGHQQPGMPPQGGQYGHTPQPAAASGEIPGGIKRIGLMALIAGGMSLVNVVVNMAFAADALSVFSVPGILFALAVLGYGVTLPRGILPSKGLRLTGVILMMVQGGFGLIGLLGLLGVAGLIGGGLLALSLVFSLVIVGADGWAAYIFFKDKPAHVYIMGAPAGQQPAYPQQQYGQPQQGRPGAYPPPPPGYQHGGQQPGQPPYGR